MHSDPNKLPKVSPDLPILPALLLMAFGIAPCGAWAGEDPAVAAARAEVSARGPAILRSYADFLAIPNVPAQPAAQRRTAEVIRDELAKRGARAELWERPGVPPVVFGDLPAPGATTTLGLYIHYDGQPVDAEEWAQSPWQATLYDGDLASGAKPRPLPADGESVDPNWRLYARSAADDKAPVWALLSALDSLQTAGIERTVNLKLFFEGEEEIGSPNLRAFMEEHSEALAADGWLILDGPGHASGRPQLVFGVRGVTSLELTVYGAKAYLHSGHYGNWAPNPAMGLARLLASMKDGDGKILVPGFYASVIPPGAAEKRALAALPPVDAGLKEALGLARSEGDAPLAERLLLPSLNVRGLASAEVGEKARNVIPNEATASLDVRLVGGNDPEAMLDLVEAHIRNQGYHILRGAPTDEDRRRHPRLVRVQRSTGYPAARTAMDSPLAGRVIAAARRATGDDLLLQPSLGGSLPLYLFDEVLSRPVIIVPIANHDNNQHAPNENLRLGNLWFGVELLATLLTMHE